MGSSNSQCFWVYLLLGYEGEVVMDRGKREEILRNHKLWLNKEGGGVRANLGDADLRDAYLKGANLEYADLEDANLKGANLTGANLMAANLEGANLEDADLYSANLKYANLSGANLMSADLEGAKLKYANLMRANLMRANLSGANLMSADLEGAKLEGVDLWNTVGDRVYIKNIFTFEEYAIAYTHDRLQIGCENHSIGEWESFSDERILEMDGEIALEFWKKNKEYILNTTKLYPARESRHED